MAESFGGRLRELRLAAGISMGELAGRINYSKSYLSKIENDLKPPTVTLAKLCDNAVGADGALIALAKPSHRSVQVDEVPDDDKVWVMTLESSGALRFDQIDRRHLLASAGGAVLGFALPRGHRPAVDQAVIAGLRASFDHYRWLGVQTSPAAVLPQVIAHVHTLRMLVADSSEPARSELLLLASRVAEYAGWMSQEAGDERTALWWTNRAVRFAEAGQDRQLASYALVRHAELALYRQDPISTVELAERAQASDNAGPRVAGLAARCEAQGHALAGNFDAYQRALDRAATLLALPDPSDGRNPVLGSSNMVDPVSLVRGWALCDLGRPAEAAAALDRSVGRIPVAARRTRARFGVRRALAHALNGEVDQASEVIGDVLDDVARVDSATVRMDLGQLARTLIRWHNHGTVRDMYPRLTEVLRAPRPES